MKLHKDGTVEGTPEEIAEYNRLMGYPEATLDSLNHALVGALDTLNLRTHNDQSVMSTKELSKQLESRTGVEVHKIEPHKYYALIIDGLRYDMTGPATILINQD